MRRFWSNALDTPPSFTRWHTGLEMIVGEIDTNLEARVTLSLSHKERSLDILFLVDSGFNGYLAVPQSVVSQLNLPLATVQRGMTADGRVSYFDTVDVCVIWDGQPKFLRAQVLDEPLVGTQMLSGHDLQARWEVGGLFRLSLIPSG